jgi:hypothetical protein
MKAELDEKLCKLAPHLFADRRASMHSTCMCWGFEVGDGWYGLLEEAALKLEPLCKAEHDKYVHLEKSWYRYIRTVLYKSVKIEVLFKVLYWIAHRLLPNLDNPFYWYGGGPRASQVKEKFGTLRFYLTHGTDEMYAIIGEAQQKSAKTCETCGKPGRIRGRGWYYTRCHSCYKKEQK